MYIKRDKRFVNDKVKDEDRSISDWFNTLKEPYRTEAFDDALNTYGAMILTTITSSLTRAIDIGIIWDDSSMGREYWESMISVLSEGNYKDYVKDGITFHPRHVVDSIGAHEYLSSQIKKPIEDITLLCVDIGLQLTSKGLKGLYLQNGLIIEPTLIYHKPYDPAKYPNKRSIKVFAQGGVKILYALIEKPKVPSKGTK